MKKFLKKTGQFLLIFFGISILLLVVDLFIYDTNIDSVLNTKKKFENEIIVLGSSHLACGVINDSLHKDLPIQILASGGQYGMEAVTFLYNKYRHKQIGSNNIFVVELVPADEIITGFTNYYYFADNFLLSGLMPMYYYPLKEWGKIFVRIYADITSFKKNKVTKFQWNRLEGSNHPKAPFDKKRFLEYKTGNNIPIKKTVFTQSLPGILKFLSKIEIETQSKIYLLIPPGAHTHGENMREVFKNNYDNNKIIDLSCLSGLEDSSCWYDGVHLTTKGAMLFTDSLNNCLWYIYQKKFESITYKTQ